MASLLFSPPHLSLPSLLIRSISPNTLPVTTAFPSITSRRPAAAGVRYISVISALAESSKASNSIDEDPVIPLLHELSESLVLPPDYLSKLPGDLRLDLNDAAFDLASGPVLDECGQDVGELFLNLSRAWEQADTMTSNSIASKLQLLHSYLTDGIKPAIGKRLLSSGRRFEAMGQYGEGELQKIAKAMIKTGKLLSSGPVMQTDKKPKEETRTFKFGELQVELTPEKANIGAAIGFAFGLLSWGFSQSIQNIPESSFQYANDNALILAKSLWGSLLVLSYSSAVLSAFASVGLLLLGRQLSSQNKSEEP